MLIIRMKSIKVKYPVLIHIILFLIFLRFALALYYPVFSDANMYFYQAKRIAEDPSLLVNPDITYFPPLLFITGAFIYTILGDLGLKLIAPFFGAVGIYYTYRLGRELFDEKVGLFGAILLGIIPAHIYLSSMGYMDSMVTGLSIAFVYYFYKADTFKRMVLAGVFAGLAAISKLTGLIVFIFIAVYFGMVLALHLRNDAKNIKLPIDLLKKGVYVSIIGFAISAPYYLRNWILFKNPLFPIGGTTIHYTRTFDPGVLNFEYYGQLVSVANPSSTIFDYIKEIFLDFWGIPTGQISAISFIPSFVIYAFIMFSFLISFFFIFGVICNFSRNAITVYALLLTWLLVLLILKTDLIWGFRRLLPITPFIAILAACEFQKFSKSTIFTSRIKLEKVASIILLLAVIAFPASQVVKAQYARDYFNNYEESLKYLRGLPDDTIVLTPYEEQTIYYSERKTMSLTSLNPAALNITALMEYNITHVVRTEHFIFFNLSKYNEAIDQMVINRDLDLLWESNYVKIYKVM